MSTAQTLADAVSALNNVATSHEQLNATMTAQQDVVEANFKALQDFATHPDTATFKDKNGTSFPVKSLRKLAADAEAVNPNPHVMTKAEFDALREMRKQQYAGSGFVEWGKHYSRANYQSASINEGMYSVVDVGYENTLSFGFLNGDYVAGNSKTRLPMTVIDGVLIELSQDKANSYGAAVLTKLPAAPDGTKTYDSSTGVVTKHATAEVAFASETATNKVILTRKDLVFLEVWHEKIADKDVVYPLGNVQYGAATWQGVNLLNNLVEQGYSAFGEWDANAKGYGAKWSTLTDAQRAAFLVETKNNIYFDAVTGSYIQVRYRVRVVEGPGDAWHRVSADGIKDINQFLGFSSSNQQNVVKPRGAHTNVLDLASHPAGDLGMYKTPLTVKSFPDAGLGAFTACKYDGTIVSDISANNHCHVIPIALVQRLNQGAYHPVLNPFGCNQFTQTNTGNYQWYNLPASFVPTVVSCFMPGTASTIGKHPTYATIASNFTGRQDAYKFYDAIYAGQVEDLRLSAKKQNVQQLLETSMQKAISGTQRGKGKVPFTRIFKVTVDSNTPQSYGRIPITQEAADYIKQAVGLVGNVTNILNKSGCAAFAFNPASNQLVVISSIFNESNVNCNFATYQTNSTTLFAEQIGNTSLFRQQLDANRRGATLLTGSGNSAGVSTASFCAPGDELYLFIEQDLSPEFDDLPWVDLVGHPERILATFPNGVIGQWVSKLPDNSYGYSLNQKVSGTVISAVYSRDDGETWGTTNIDLDSIENKMTGSWAPSIIALIYYTTLSKVSSSASQAAQNANLDGVFVSQDNFIANGCRLTSSLINTIPKSNLASYRQNIFSLISKGRRLASMYDSTYTTSPKHELIDFAKGHSDGGAVKVFTSVVKKNGLYYAQFNGAELKHNGTDWGDDQTIPIINGENVKTDLNGDTVKVFCHHSVYPLGIAHND